MSPSYELSTISVAHYAAAVSCSNVTLCTRSVGQFRHTSLATGRQRPCTTSGVTLEDETGAGFAGHLIAGKLIDCSHLLEQLKVKSGDFN